MTVMHSFCLWFPVRLGAIIVGISAGLQSLSCLIACIVGITDTATTSNVIGGWLDKNEMLVSTVLFSPMRDDPSSFLKGFISALTIHLFTCILLLIGAFRCNRWLIYPFVGIDFFRLVLLSIFLVVALLIIKANTLTLGLVIGGSISGGFILLYLWYQWLCVISLCQILMKLERMDYATSQVSTRLWTISEKMNPPKTLAFQVFPKNLMFPQQIKHWTIADLPRPT